MNNCCIYLKIKTKKYQKFPYCSKAQRKINFNCCKNCPFKIYKKKNRSYKRKENLKSIMPIFSVGSITCFNKPIKYYHKHHIFEGNGNRQLSEKYGLFVWVLPSDHLNCFPKSIHSSMDIQNKLKKYAQKVFQETYPHLDFVAIFHENYLKRR